MSKTQLTPKILSGLARTYRINIAVYGNQAIVRSTLKSGKVRFARFAVADAARLVDFCQQHEYPVMVNGVGDVLDEHNAPMDDPLSAAEAAYRD